MRRIPQALMPSLQKALMDCDKFFSVEIMNAQTQRELINTIGHVNS